MTHRQRFPLVYVSCLHEVPSGKGNHEAEWFMKIAPSPGFRPPQQSLSRAFPWWPAGEQQGPGRRRFWRSFLEPSQSHWPEMIEGWGFFVRIFLFWNKLKRCLFFCLLFFSYQMYKKRSCKRKRHWVYLTKELIAKSKFEQVCCLNDSEKLVI